MDGNKAYQVQLTHIDEEGEEIKVYPKNHGMDVTVGQLSSGELVPPGSNKNETLDVTLANIRKYLTNLSDVAKTLREVSQDSKDASTVNIPSSAVTAGLQTSIDSILEEITEIKDYAAGLAPIMHADDTTKYGGATGTKYGHVKLSDVYAIAEANAGAANSVGASQNALYNAWNNLNTNKAPNNHAVNAATYGKGTNTLYGHVKTSDVYDSTSTDAAEVATRKALFNAYTALKGVNDSQTTAINGKAPTSHASSATIYGVGTTGNFGHLKISDGFNTDNSGSGAAANGVAASSWSVYRAYSTLSGVVNNKLASTHANEKATGRTYSHVKLTDTYSSSQGAASSGIAPSSLALYNAHAALSSSITSLQNSVNTLNNNMYKRSRWENGSLTQHLMGEFHECTSGMAIVMECSDKPGPGWELVTWHYDSGLLLASLYDLTTFDYFITAIWIECPTLTWNKIHTNANSIKDIGNNRDITFRYSADGLADAKWLAAWDGYELRAISKDVVKSIIGIPVKLYGIDDISFSLNANLDTVIIGIRDSSGNNYQINLDVDVSVDGLLQDLTQHQIHKKDELGY